MHSMEKIRVVLGDDHALVRTGVRTLLDSHGIDVVAEAGDGRTLVKEVRAHKPDIALVDISMPSLDGFEATRRILRVSPSTRVVILSMHGDERFIARAVRCGAQGYVLKDDAVERLIEVVERVAGGEPCLPDVDLSMEEELTAKEREVLQLILEGKTNAEISEIMNRSVHTIRNHRARLMEKLGVRSAAELARATDETVIGHRPLRKKRDGS